MQPGPLRDRTAKTVFAVHPGGHSGQYIDIKRFAIATDVSLKYYREESVIMICIPFYILKLLLLLLLLFL